jgi:hypothetical protein
MAWASRAKEVQGGLGFRVIEGEEVLEFLRAELYCLTEGQVKVKDS